MTEWFNQRFISRDEHEEIVEYYRKQVARLYHDLRELRAQSRPPAAVEPDAPARSRQVRHRQQVGGRDNVICIDFRRPR